MKLLGILGTNEIIIILIIFFLILTPLLLCSFICGRIAQSKNRDKILWGVIGFAFNIFGILVIALLRPVVKREEEKYIK